MEVTIINSKVNITTDLSTLKLCSQINGWHINSLPHTNTCTKSYQVIVLLLALRGKKINEVMKLDYKREKQQQQQQEIISIVALTM